jgi:hypothetical protein
VSGYSKFYAVLLLTVFCRVLVPDSLVLALHNHTHTVEEKVPAQSGKFQLDVKHIHCPVEHLFDSSFYSLPIALTFPVFLMPATFYRQHTAVWKFTFPNNTYLRGPPAVAILLA